MTPDQLVAALAAGALIGLVLGLIGAGGSIIAVPLLVYVVGLHDAHGAIGTAAVAVSLSALLSLWGHARAGHVKWNCALVFAAAGSLGAVFGARGGQAMDGPRLLALFGLLMLVVGVSMLRPRRSPPDPSVKLTRQSAGVLLPKLLPIGFGTGLLAGFFGIGGGFLIVPGLLAATAMPIAFAIGTSLVAVFAFGATTATSYALAGHVDWQLTLLLVAGGGLGAALGIHLGRSLEHRRRLMNQLFACAVIATGLWMLAMGLPALGLRP